MHCVEGMIMGASASSVWYNLRVPHPCREVPILDYDLALLFQPMLMLGITLGVALSVVFPYWLITILTILLFSGNIINYHLSIKLHFDVSVYYNNQYLLKIYKFLYGPWINYCCLLILDYSLLKKMKVRLIGLIMYS